jgi:Beta-galactosidase
VKTIKTLKHLTLLALLSLIPMQGKAVNPEADKAGTFTTGKKTFLLNDRPFLVKAAELHYPRIPRDYWEHRIKMCKALGMNTVCMYVFWNIHEQKEGKFDFSGNNDIAEFCRLCKKNDMYVIVRPGPYVCAEWEMGGLPWWLLKKKDIRLREQDPYFMERVRLFMGEVGKQLSPLTIEKGGPIIMVQVENEYGSYGEDKQYVGEIRDIVRASGFDKVQLFQCDWASNFTKNGLDDLTWTMNFGTGANIDAQFKRLGELRPDAPQMCSEFWSGWFDKWGAKHETRPAKKMVDNMEEMITKGISFSLYMTHGGTSFGHWAGANSPGFAPDVTSYDYDAPINEYGKATPKYYELREMMQRHSKEKLPKVPGLPAKIITVPQFSLDEYAPLSYGISNTLTARTPLTFEEMDMGWGTAMYSTELPELEGESLLTLNEGHDYSQVFIDGKLIGSIDRVRKEKSLALPAVKKGSRLTIVVEAMGRINFGRAIKDFKGITNGVTIKTSSDGHELTWDLKNWQMDIIPDDYATALQAFGMKAKTASPIEGASGYYRGWFNLSRTGDTFLNVENLGKGQVYVNGHALGRFWHIGPQQTLYVPGCWLRKGRNEVIVLDVAGPKKPVVWCQDSPELDKLQTEKPRRNDNPENRPDLASSTPIAASSFTSGNGWQTVRFAKPAEGRHIAIECLTTHDGTGNVQIAELYLLDTAGRRISREPWTVKYADSEDINRNMTGEKAFDLQESTYWSTAKNAKAPHLLVIDLGTRQTVSALEYLPRAETGAPGSVKDYRIFVY